MSCRYIIKNQTTGDRLNIRVVAMNPGGRSPPATLPDAVLVREVVGKSRFYWPESSSENTYVTVQKWRVSKIIRNIITI